jgi:DNA-binding response OmpR family regulator
MDPESIQVLLVEDNPGDARLVELAFEEAGPVGLELEDVERLSEAIERVSERAFDAILLDLSLPDSKGLDTVTRALKHARGVPIVVLTATDDEELGLTAVRKGAQDYLVKGRFDGDLLLRSVRYAIERQGRKRAEEALRRSQDRNLWRSLSQTTGQGASAILYRAGIEQGLNSFDLLQGTWDGGDEERFVRVLRDYFQSTNLLNLRRLAIDRETSQLMAEFQDSFEATRREEDDHEPACHFLRGILCGLAEGILKVPDLVCDEVACEALGDETCKFRVHPVADKSTSRRPEDHRGLEAGGTGSG